MDICGTVAWNHNTKKLFLLEVYYVDLKKN